MSSRINSVKLETLCPTPPRSIEGENAPRLDSVEGKTICEGWPLSGWRADETFPLIRAHLKRRFPTTKIIPYTEFPRLNLSPLRGQLDNAIPLEQIGQILKGMGCDGVILGNGG
ncbi:MAG: hypothetical protein JRJ03_02585 [Deltaproteobacteria bacterium]|nr:hypothetical protein [Deltaproteobacteria bacterium]